MNVIDITDTDNQNIWLNLWNTYGNNMPFLHPSWHDIWFRTIGTAYTPLILHTHDVIFPFAKSQVTVEFSGGTEIADYLDALGNDMQKIQEWPNILEYIKSIGIKEIILHNVPETSKTFEFFQSKKDQQSTFTIMINKEDSTPKLSLPNTWDSFLTTLERQSRHELERKIRKFEREYVNSSYRSHQRTEGMHTLFRLMKNNPEKQSFLTETMETFLLEISFAFSQYIEYSELMINDEVIASTAAFISGDEYLLYNSGYKYEIKGSGFYLKAKTIEHAITKELKTYNFLQGTERYKYELGGKDYFVYTIMISLQT